MSLITLVPALPITDSDSDIHLAASHFKYPWLNMTLSNLEAVCNKPKGSDLYDCTVECRENSPRYFGIMVNADIGAQVDFYDFNTEGVVDVNGAHCNATWQWDGITPDNGPKNNFPSNGAVCWSAASNAFMFKVVEFRSASNFMMYVSHLYRDSRFFQFPWDGRKAIVEIKIPDNHPSPPLAPYIPPVDQFQFIATATISKRTDGLS